MPQGLWVEHRTDAENCIHLISIEGCEFVAQFIDRIIGSGTQLGIPRDSRITLHGPSGTVIRSTEPISVLIPGNSTENPLRVQVSASLPVPVKPAPDANLTSFWNSLRDISKEKGFLHFSVKPEFFPDLMKSLYVRKSYEDLFGIIWGKLNPKDPKRLGRIAITGTPGIGKSMLLIYVLWRLAQMEDTKTVILRRFSDAGRIHVFQNDGCWITRTLDDVDKFLSESTTWYLADALLDQPGRRNASTVLVSSPSEKYYSEFFKFIPIPPLHYLPIWSLKELKLVGPSYYRNENVVKERFNKVGGIVRYVLEEDGDLEVKIKSKIEKLLKSKSIKLPSSEETWKDDISHRLVHFKVDQSCYTKCTLIMASEYVRKMFFEALHERDDEEIRRFISLFKNVPGAASASGILFERRANRLLSAGGEFLVRSLDDGSEKKVKFPPTMPEEFTTLSACTNPAIYYTPEAENFPCIDSLIPGIGYFQMTISLEHKIPRMEMKTIKSVMKMEKFYFVVPNTNYRNFEKQKYKGGDRNIDSGGDNSGVDGGTNTEKGNSEGSKDPNWNKKRRRNVIVNKKKNNSQVLHEDLVRQYVISIPIDREMAKSIARAGQEKRIIRQDGEEEEDGENEEGKREEREEREKEENINSKKKGTNKKNSKDMNKRSSKNVSKRNSEDMNKRNSKNVKRRSEEEADKEKEDMNNKKNSRNMNERNSKDVKRKRKEEADKKKENMSSKKRKTNKGNSKGVKRKNGKKTDKEKEDISNKKKKTNKKNSKDMNKRNSKDVKRKREEEADREKEDINNKREEEVDREKEDINNKREEEADREKEDINNKRKKGRTRESQKA
jgi:hypothetical protein